MRTTSILQAYKIDRYKGMLTAICTWLTEKTPRGFNIDPRGKSLLSVGMDSAAMTVHFDQSNGERKPSHQYPMGHAVELG